MTRRGAKVPDELKIADGPKPCSRCKLPTIFRTQRGRAVHPTCEPVRGSLSDQDVRRAVGEAAVLLKPLSMAEEPPAPPHKPGPQPTVLQPAPYPCAGCGTTVDVIRWLPADVWRCAEHTPLRLPAQPWEMRGYPAPPTREETREHRIA